MMKSLRGMTHEKRDVLREPFLKEYDAMVRLQKTLDSSAYASTRCRDELIVTSKRVNYNYSHISKNVKLMDSEIFWKDETGISTRLK